MEPGVLDRMFLPASPPLSRAQSLSMPHPMTSFCEKPARRTASCRCAKTYVPSHAGAIFVRSTSGLPKGFAPSSLQRTPSKLDERRSDAGHRFNGPLMVE